MKFLPKPKNHKVNINVAIQALFFSSKKCFTLLLLLGSVLVRLTANAVTGIKIAVKFFVLLRQYYMLPPVQVYGMGL